MTCIAGDLICTNHQFHNASPQHLPNTASRTMPPKSRRTKTSTAQKKKPGQPSSSLTPQQLAALTEAWTALADSTAAPIPRHGVRSVLSTLGLSTNRHELAEILDTVDPENTGEVRYDRLLEVVELKMQFRDTEREIEEAYELFAPGPGGIGVQELRRVAEELKEEVGERELWEMVEVATGGGRERVTLEDFEDVMRRAGVI